MMRRHWIPWLTFGALAFLLAGGACMPGTWAADAKAVSPAPAAGKPAGEAVKAAPPAQAPAKPADPATPSGKTATATPVSPEAAPAGETAKSGPAPTQPSVETYEYSATGKTDPFAPFLETDPVLKAKKEEEERRKALAAQGRPISPLQQVEIDQLKLVGIAGNDQKRTAVVEDGIAKKHYPLSVGTYVGMNGGRVVLIRPDRVIIEERLPGQSPKAKKPKVKRITVMLHQEDEAQP